MSEFVKLTEYCDVNMGQSPASSSYNAEQRGIPFFQGNADFGNQNPHVRLWCNAPTKIAHCGDLLLSVRAPIGALNIADCTCCIGRGLAALTAKQKVCDPSWLYFALKSKISELQAQGTGSTFKAINKAALQNLLLPSCSLSEQQHIASVLRKVCCLITARQQQLTLLDQLAKSRFIEMFGAETEFKRWRCITIGEIADVRVGVVIKPTQYYTDDGIPAFRSLNIGKMEVKNTDWIYFTEEGHKKNQKSVIRKNDVLVVRSGAPGTACVATEQYDGYNAVDIIIARPDNDRINSVFLAAFTNMPHGIMQIRKQTGGAAQQHFNVGSYKAMKIILPPLELQNEFAAFIEQLDKSKVTIRKSIEKLETTYRALLQEYFEIS